MATTRLDIEINASESVSTSLRAAESRIIRFVGAISASLAALQTISFPIEKATTFDRALRDVQKTTGFTDQQTQQLSGNLLGLSSNLQSTADELAQVAASAGQLGLGDEGIDSILAFTESVSRASTTLDLLPDQAATEFAKLSNIFKLPIREVERLISSTNELSNTTVASADQIINVTKRIGNLSGLQATQVQALAATALELGVAPEVAGTSLVKIISNFEALAPKFANLLNISVDDFLSEDALTRLKLYLDRLTELGPAQRQAQIATLSGTGRIGALVSKFVSDAENDYQILDKALGNANEAFLTGTSSIEEYERVSKALSVQLDILRNKFTNLAITEGLEVIAEQILPFVKELQESLDTEEVKIQIEELIGTIGDIVGGIIKAIRYVADLDIEFQNVVQAIKIFVGINIVRFLAGITAGIVGQIVQLVVLLASWRNVTAALQRYGSAVVGVNLAALGGASQAQRASNAAAVAAAGGALAASGRRSTPADRTGGFREQARLANARQLEEIDKRRNRLIAARNQQFRQIGLLNQDLLRANIDDDAAQKRITDSVNKRAGAYNRVTRQLEQVTSAQRAIQTSVTGTAALTAAQTAALGRNARNAVNEYGRVNSQLVTARANTAALAAQTGGFLNVVRTAGSRVIGFLGGLLGPLGIIVTLLSITSLFAPGFITDTLKKLGFIRKEEAKLNRERLAENRRYVNELQKNDELIRKGLEQTPSGDSEQAAQSRRFVGVFELQLDEPGLARKAKEHIQRVLESIRSEAPKLGFDALYDGDAIAEGLRETAQSVLQVQAGIDAARNSQALINVGTVKQQETIKALETERDEIRSQLQSTQALIEEYNELRAEGITTVGTRSGSPLSADVNAQIDRELERVENLNVRIADIDTEIAEKSGGLLGQLRADREAISKEIAETAAALEEAQREVITQPSRGRLAEEAGVVEFGPEPKSVAELKDALDALNREYAETEKAMMLAGDQEEQLIDRERRLLEIREQLVQSPLVRKLTEEGIETLKLAGALKEATQQYKNAEKRRDEFLSKNKPLAEQQQEGVAPEIKGVLNQDRAATRLAAQILLDGDRLEEAVDFHAQKQKEAEETLNAQRATLGVSQRRLVDETLPQLPSASDVDKFVEAVSGIDPETIAEANKGLHDTAIAYIAQKVALQDTYDEYTKRSADAQKDEKQFQGLVDNTRSAFTALQRQIRSLSLSIDETLKNRAIKITVDSQLNIFDKRLDSQRKELGVQREKVEAQREELKLKKEQGELSDFQFRKASEELNKQEKQIEVREQRLTRLENSGAREKLQAAGLKREAASELAQVEALNRQAQQAADDAEKTRDPAKLQEALVLRDAAQRKLEDYYETLKEMSGVTRELRDGRIVPVVSDTEIRRLESLGRDQAKDLLDGYAPLNDQLLETAKKMAEIISKETSDVLKEYKRVTDELDKLQKKDAVPVDALEKTFKEGLAQQEIPVRLTREDVDGVPTFRRETEQEREERLGPARRPSERARRFIPQQPELGPEGQRALQLGRDLIDTTPLQQTINDVTVAMRGVPANLVSFERLIESFQGPVEKLRTTLQNIVTNAQDPLSGDPLIGETRPQNTIQFGDGLVEAVEGGVFSGLSNAQIRVYINGDPIAVPTRVEAGPSVGEQLSAAASGAK